MNRVICYIGVLMVLLPSCSDDKGPGPTPSDTTPPTRVVDLTVQSAVGSAVTLSWTAPGDDGTDEQASRYDLRYSRTSLAGAGWDSATVAGSLPAPKPAGQVESATIVDLAPGAWHIALKAADEALNWSAMSNSVNATVVDTIPPGPVADLAAASSGLTSVRLSWTAPGNDGATGRASEYDLRHARTPITEETWEDAVRVDGLPRPAPAGQLQFFTVMGLELATNYFFALKTADGVPNWSARSNVVSRSTPSISISRLTVSAQPLGAGPPRWSPDGQTILTYADWQGPMGQVQLYLIPANGGEPVRLTHDPYPIHNHDACWSPDGTQIAFVSDRSGNSEIYVMAAVPDAEPFQVTHLGILNLSGCVWSPDGTRIAYVALPSMDPLTFRIYTVPYTGGPATALVGASPGSEPAWSPEGTRVAFTSKRSGNYEIYVVPAEGGVPIPLTDDPAYDRSPAWSPDGSQIAFSSSRAGNGDLWLMSSDGGNPTPITFDAADEGSPSWSPDGSRIAFERWTREGISDIWVLAGLEATGQYVPRSGFITASGR